MSLPPQKFREIVFQLLFSQELGDLDMDYAVPLMMSELRVTRRSVKEALEKGELVGQRALEIDAEMQNCSQGYRLERMHTVERVALRLGIYEMLYDEKIPAKVAISEAMRLARKFGSPEGANFVNAIMDQVYKGRVLGEEALLVV
ncbi:MAG: transcription antitermination factor NusB [Waddliaceae bacterium]|nr:transcription antitermination factor NusB [Waddliaceae bacterium]